MTDTCLFVFLELTPDEELATGLFCTDKYGRSSIDRSCHAKRERCDRVGHIAHKQ